MSTDDVNSKLATRGKTILLLCCIALLIGNVISDARMDFLGFQFSPVTTIGRYLVLALLGYAIYRRAGWVWRIYAWLIVAGACYSVFLMLHFYALTISSPALAGSSGGIFLWLGGATLLNGGVAATMLLSPAIQAYETSRLLLFIPDDVADQEPLAP